VGTQAYRRLSRAGRGAPVSLTEDQRKQLSGKDNAAGDACLTGRRRRALSRGSIPASKWHYLLIENRGHRSRNPERS